ncbi:MAG TPA: Hsp70 family protein, partial [Candidatus Binatia bacterium]
DSKLVRRLIAPMLGLGSEYKSQFGNILPVPNWLYEHLERWHYLSFLKTRKNLDLLRQILFQALEPKKISALIELVDNDLGYRLYQAVEQTKCKLSASAVSEFQFREAEITIDDSVRREAFEGWIDRELRQISECIDQLLSRCNAAPHDVDAIFMTGGSSFVPAIRRIFENKFGSGVPIRVGQEFTSVAEGLAIYALELLG